MTHLLTFTLFIPFQCRALLTQPGQFFPPFVTIIERLTIMLVTQLSYLLYLKYKAAC